MAVRTIQVWGSSNPHAAQQPARNPFPAPRTLIVVTLLLVAALFTRAQTVFAQLPSLEVFANSGPAGLDVALRGSNFPPGTAYILWNGVQVGQLTVSPNGSFVEPFEIPRAATVGDYEVGVCAPASCLTPSGRAFDSFNVTESGRIRVCRRSAAECLPAETSSVYRTRDRRRFNLDSDGYIIDRDDISPGDLLWTLYPSLMTDDYVRYFTNGAPDEVSDEKFVIDGSAPGVMTMVVTADDSLLSFNLDVSAQWNLTAAERAILRRRIVAASNHLYDFTDGQALIGDAVVRMDYEGWDEANVWIYADNNLRPKATAGGIVDAALPDADNPEVVYYPGHIHIGNYWNRFNRPPGEPIFVNGQLVPPNTYADDYSLALAHENGHYLFFLFDTYFGVNEDFSVFQVDACTGSAMGWVYEPENWGFVYDQADWDANCGETHANQLLGRTEWATMQQHYPWLDAPTTFVEGPSAPPIPMTDVLFINPAEPSNPLADQTFDLQYENGETASRRAEAYLYRNGRVIAQGNAPKGGTSIQLTGAQEGDLLCLYDIDANPPAPNTPRHQYGCETLEIGDNSLDLERNTNWAPIVLLDPISETQIQISVMQPLGAVELRARLYREHEQDSALSILQQNGDAYTGVIDVGESTPSAFVRVFVNETNTETNPRREALAMYGVGGGTVPGPSSWDEKAPVYSPDGEASAWPIEAVQLQAGSWVSIQYMVATYDSPPNNTRLSDAYRVISWPPSLAQSIVAVITTNESSAPVAEAITADVPAIHYWNGSRWIRLETDYHRQPDGTIAASAIVPGSAIFALFDSPPLTATFLPTAGR